MSTDLETIRRVNVAHAEQVANLEARVAQLEAALQEIARLRLATGEGTCAQRFDKAWGICCESMPFAAETKVESGGALTQCDMDDSYEV